MPKADRLGRCARSRACLPEARRRQRGDGGTNAAGAEALGRKWSVRDGKQWKAAGVFRFERVPRITGGGSAKSESDNPGATRQRTILIGAKLRHVPQKK